MQPPHYAVTLEREQGTISAEELSQGLGRDQRHIGVFGDLIHIIVNKHLLNFSIYSSQAKLGQFIALETVSTARDGPCSNERGSWSKRGVLSFSFTNVKWRGLQIPSQRWVKFSAAEPRIEPLSQIPVLTCSHIKPVLPSTSANWFTQPTWWTSKPLPGQLFNKGRSFKVGKIAHLGWSRFCFISCQEELLLLFEGGVKTGRKRDEIHVISQLVREKWEVDRHWDDLIHLPCFWGWLSTDLSSVVLELLSCSSWPQLMSRKLLWSAENSM